MILDSLKISIFCIISCLLSSLSLHVVNILYKHKILSSTKSFFGSSPKNIKELADKVNIYLENKEINNVSIILMDYPNDKIIRKIINRNHCH